MMKWGSDYKELTAFINCLDSVDVHFCGQFFNARCALIHGQREYTRKNKVLHILIRYIDYTRIPKEMDVFIKTGF
jgi:hypothetical protein